MTQNLLAHETSPYLLQHQHNPIHWMAWGEAAFTRAATEDKPVLLSIGYAACHWCHVMAHESFEDQDIAGQVNRDFIAIKVDREERPDVDKIYMDALHSLGEPGGWPLTMFLDGKARPFWGGTYFPKSPRYGKPGFGHVLREIARLWRDERHKIAANSDAILAALTSEPAAAQAVDFTPARITVAAQALLRAVDLKHGGLTGAPKFPQSPFFRFLQAEHLRQPDPALADAINVTLTRICQGGIYDHLGGGVCRYSTDARWLAPHYEKMLCDNAQLVSCLTRAWSSARTPLYAARLRETIGFMLTRMTTAEGAFAASYDADSEGEEGTYYVWSLAEINALLGSDAAGFAAAYDVTAAGNWEGHTILNRLGDPLTFPAANEASLAASRAKLLAARAARIAPGFDDKVLADWNGLAITALAEAALVFNEPPWAAAAERAFQRVLGLLRDAGTLRHSARAGKLRAFATADGYAHLISAGLALHGLSGNQTHLSTSVELANELHQSHWNASRGAYDMASRHESGLIVRPCFGSDDATPTANAVLAQNLLKLARITGDATFQERADHILAAFSAAAASNPFGYATLLAAHLERMDPLDVVITGQAAMPLLHHLASRCGPDLTVTHVAADADLPANHPAHGKAAGPAGRLYLCRGQTCAAPAADIAGVEAALALLGLGG